MTKNRIIMTFCVGQLLCYVACAQCPTPKANTADAVELPATVDDSIDLLFATLDLEKTYENILVSALDEQIRGNPQIAPVRDVMEAFFRKYMGWEAVEPELKKLYVQSFTKEEIDAMIVFYRTPAGKKAATLTPKLMEQGSEMGRRMVRERLPELTKMIEQELQKSAPASLPIDSAQP